MYNFHPEKENYAYVGVHPGYIEQLFIEAIKASIETEKEEGDSECQKK